MPTVEDGEKLESVSTVERRGCRYYLEKIFKENLKGGEIYDFSCNWLTGIKLTPSPLSPPKTEKADYINDEDDGDDSKNGDYSSFFKKVLRENTKGGVLHEFSYSWLFGPKLTPIAFSPKIDQGNNYVLLPLDGYKKLFTLVVLKNLQGGILHEYSYGRMTSVRLTPILPGKGPSLIRYDHKVVVLEDKLICHHFVRGTGLLDDKIVLQPYRVSPDKDDHKH